MLTALRLGNFKAFGPTQRLPIKPITLIFGPNSAGKSSLIHGLALAHEALREGTLDVYRTQIGGSSIDLGGFRQYVFRRNPESTVEWSVDLDLTQAKGRLADLLAAATTVRLTVSIGIPLDNEGRPEAGAEPHVRRFELEADEAMLLQMGRRRDGTYRFDRLDTSHPVMRQVFRAMLELGTTVTSASDVDEESLSRAVDEVLPTLNAAAGPLLPARVQGLGEREGTAFEVSAMLPVSRGTRGADLTEVARFFLPRVLDELLRELNTALKSQLDRLRYLGPLRSFPPRHLAFAEHDDLNWQAGGGYAWDVVRRDAKVREAVNEWLGSKERLQTPYELSSRRLIAPDTAYETLENAFDEIYNLFVEPPEEKFTRPKFSEPSLKALTAAFAPGLLPGIAEEIKKQLLEKAAEGLLYHTREQGLDLWENELLANDVLRRLKADDRIEGLDELVLIDRRTDTVVSHRDVGIGISQVLPVLVAAHASREQIVAIEQPEIHIHPALQADLGDIFIDSALNRGNTFLLETHSEHLILRVLRRIREASDGELPEGVQSLTPGQVQVIYAEPTKNGTVLHEIPVTEDGEFGCKWPHGFFTERAKELF